jgi:hypothetical protein
MSDQSGLNRTAIYIDGYNLYYGRLLGTEYKWLDVVSLFGQIIRSIEPASQVVAINWTRTYIRDDELKNALLPDQVPTRKKPAKKPPHW